MKATTRPASDHLRSANLSFSETSICSPTDLICLSHLRWDFVFQRPQHLMTRHAQHRRVFFVEEPMFGDLPAAKLDVSPRTDGVLVVVPHLPRGIDPDSIMGLQRRLFDELMAEYEIEDCTLWYYTPMALSFTSHIEAKCVVYDCMDELAAFKNAPRELIEFEKELFRRADMVFTGGHSLYEAKRNHHQNVHAFPSSIEFEHFAKARQTLPDPDDQKDIPHPRIGFYGVLDERADLELLEGIARLRPDWHFVMIGPVVKIDPASLPRYSNIHYLGMKSYTDLPRYLAGWDLAMLPFALNESTRFISPTKTPEYLAAGRPVVSTPIRDVVRPYGDEGLVHIAATAPEFIRAAETAMAERREDRGWQTRVDAFLSRGSWDKTWNQMACIELESLESRFMGEEPMGQEHVAMAAESALPN